MSDRTSTLTFLAKDAASGPVKAIDKAMDKLHGTAGRVGGGLKKVGAGILEVGKFATIGLGLLVGGLTVAAKAAADDAASTAALNQVIKANVKTAGDYTAALDKTIAAGQKLAFTDDETRASMSRLVVSTKDVAEASRLNVTAMDLARLKGISLADAANIVAKAHDGNFAALKKMGIVLKEGATATDALAAIQAAAAGQAETYGNSSVGALARIQDGFGELVEKIGTAVLPILDTLTAFVLESVLPAVEGIATKISAVLQGSGDLGASLSGLVSGAMTTFKGILETVIPILTSLWDTITNKVIPTVLDLATRVWEGGLNKAVEAGAKVIGSVITVIGELVTAITSNEDVMNILRTVADGIGKAFGLAADAVLFTLDFLGQLGDKIRSNEGAMNFLKKVGGLIADGFKLAGEAIRVVIDAITEAIRLAGVGADAIAKFAAGTPANGAPKPPTWRKPITSPLDIPGEMAGEVGSLFGGLGDLLFRGGKPPEFATGGIVPGFLGQPTLAVVHGGERITPAGGGGGTWNVTFNISGADDPDTTARRVLQALQRERQRQGMSLAG